LPVTGCTGDGVPADVPEALTREQTLGIRYHSAADKLTHLAGPPHSECIFPNRIATWK